MITTGFDGLDSRVRRCERAARPGAAVRWWRSSRASQGRSPPARRGAFGASSRPSIRSAPVNGPCSFSGNVPPPPAAETPGSASSRSSSRSQNAGICGPLYLEKFRSIRIVRRLSVLKPGSTRCRLSTVRSVRPAPMSSMNDAATWTTMSTLRTAWRFCVVRPPSESAGRCRAAR